MTVQEAIRIADIDAKLADGGLLTMDEVDWIRDQVKDVPLLSDYQAISILKDRALQVLARYTKENTK